MTYQELRTKRGLTSIIVVIIVILILSVIAVSFTRLIMSEAVQSTNTDLSQSAYDSALAGIEDAKSALLQYHDCLSNGFTATNSGANCSQLISAMQLGIKNHDCDTVAKALGRKIENGGVVIQETASSSSNGNSSSMLQAYTCVTIEEELNDYRTTLDADNIYRIIPIRVSQIHDISYFTISWFSAENLNDLHYGNTNFCNGSGLYSLAGCNGKFLAPPVIGVGLMQADVDFSLSELVVANNGDGRGHTDRAYIYLKPNNVGSAEITEISSTTFASTGTDSKGFLQEVNCGATYYNSTGFFCTAKIYIPDTFKGGPRNEGAFFLSVSLPYTQPATDISAQAYDGSGNLIVLDGVQARVDSTGRANDLYRRIETRIELVDTYFPFPQYEIQMSSGASVINKTFRSTKNCWWTDSGGFGKVGCENFLIDSSLSNF